MTPDEYVQRLHEASYKKYRLMKELLDLTRAQARSIASEDLKGMEKLVAEKQEKIDAVNKLDEEFDVYFRRLKSALNVNSLDELKNSNVTGVRELKETIGRILGLVREINELENQNNEKARALLDTYGEEIKKINQGKRVNSAYMPAPATPQSYFFDKKK